MNKGLVNSGNYCYLNATLQALFHSTSLRKIIEDQCNNCDRNMCVKCGIRDTLDLTTDSTAPIEPVVVIMLLKKIAPTLTHGRQEDSHEFLMCLIDAMDKDNFPPSSIHQQLVWNISTTTECSSCRNKNYATYNDTVVSLEMAESLQRAIDLYFDEERIDEYNCEHCHKKGSATKKFSVSKAPSVLVLHIKRFNPDGTKNSSPMNVPRELVLQDAEYMLVSCVMHHGESTKKGHYTCIGYHEGRFFNYDDSQDAINLVKVKVTAWAPD